MTPAGAKAKKTRTVRLQIGPEAAQLCAPDSGQIITKRYPLQQMCAVFRKNYHKDIGFSIMSKRPDLGNFGISPLIAWAALRLLGFRFLEEWRAETIGVRPTEGELNVLFMMSSKSTLNISGPNYLQFKPFVGRMYFMCTKWYLVYTMRCIEHRMGMDGLCFTTGSGRDFSHLEFTPYTLNLNNKRLEQILAEKPGAYLAKPTRGSMGQGQQLVHISKDHVHENLLDFLLSSQFLEMHRSEVILQRYVERPLLVDKRKFDMRVYMLVVNAKRLQPLPEARASGESNQLDSGYFVFMHPGFLRLCTAPYDLDQTDLAVHLTNQSVQAKQTSTFQQLKEVTTWYPDELNHYFNRRRRLPVKDWVKDVLYPKVGAVLGYVSDMFRRHLDDRDCQTNTFRILGADFLVDEDLRVYLLEFNSHPSWSRQTSVLNVLKPNLWREATCLTTEVVVRYRAKQPVTEDQLLTRQNFRLVYTSEDAGMARRNVARLFD